MVTLTCPSVRSFTMYTSKFPVSHSPCASVLMCAQPGNSAGARPPQVAKATIAQIAAILGFMLTLSQTRTARSSGKREAFSCDSVCCVTRRTKILAKSPAPQKFRKKLYVRQNRRTRCRSASSGLLSRSRFADKLCTKVLQSERGKRHRDRGPYLSS
jgi:hypothetical protein